MKLICRTFLIFAFILSLTATAAGNDDNLIQNNDFSKGTDSWWLGQQEGGEASFTASAGVLSVKIKNPGRRPWAVLVGQSGLAFEKDIVYEVSFEARSHEIERFRIQTAMKDAPYYNYSGYRYFPLEDEFRRYAFTFTMRQDSDRDALIQLCLGREGKGVVELANFRITRVGPKKETHISKNFPQPFSNRFLRGITFGNTLDAPHEGAWAPELREEYFDLIKSAGMFDHIRVPVRWDTHAQNKAPFTIEPEFMRRVDWAVSHALQRGFHVVLNIHHFDGLNANPAANKEKFIALWQQIAEYFKDYPENLYFEIYNEPHHALDACWNQYYPLAYDMIRKQNPSRNIIISCPGWANITTLDRLVLPERIKDDPNILVQFHFYYPMEFCNQGAVGNGSEDVRGHRWTGTEAQKKTMTRLADRAAQWAKRNGGVRLWNGEFCAHAGVSQEEDRRLWTAFIIQLCEERDIAWAYWDFAGDTARIYDADTGRWINILPDFK